MSVPGKAMMQGNGGLSVALYAVGGLALGGAIVAYSRYFLTRRRLNQRYRALSDVGASKNGGSLLRVGTARSDGIAACVIVGGGPSGATMAYYLKHALDSCDEKEGREEVNNQVVLLEKQKYPRDKYCGDAVCTPAIEILEEMGVMDVLKDNNEVKFADSGGMVSPAGITYIGASKEKLGQAAACAVKRINLDYRIMQSAARSGAVIHEGCDVADAFFTPGKEGEPGFWTVLNTKGDKFKARMLICADGSTSRLATKLGYCIAPPEGVCSRAFVEGGTHNCNFDGVCFYQPESVPGYSAIFKHPNDELNYCYYLIPTGNGKCGDVTEADLPRLHNEAIKNDPYISSALGPNAKIERMKAASLRLGSQGVPQSYGVQMLIIGDAAGHIDPLTGEGIHLAMQGGKCAAAIVADMVIKNDYGEEKCREYETLWKMLYGHDFFLSRVFAKTLYFFPVLMDATALEMQRQGDKMMAKWAEVMTGMRSKTYLLRIDNVLIMTFALIRENFSRYILGAKRDYYDSQDTDKSAE